MSTNPNSITRYLIAATLSLCLWTTACTGGSGPSSQAPPKPRAEPTSLPAATASTLGDGRQGPSQVPSTDAVVSPSNWPEIVAQVQSGVGQFYVTGCDFGATGTGFLIGPNLVVTAAHVVKDASAISISFGRTSVNATVLGTNDIADIALVRTEKPVQGHQFQLRTTEPPIGTDVAALGFPLGRPFTLTKGTVSALDAEQDIGNRVLRNLIQTDAAINHGNSGGPLITQDGQVTGVVVTIQPEGNIRAEGIAYAVTAPRVTTAVEEWQSRSAPVALKDCGNAPAPGTGFFPLTVSANHDQARNIGQSLILHGQGINQGAYAAAFKLFTPQLQATFGDVDKWSADLGSSYWTRAEIFEVTGTGSPDDLSVDVNLQTIQDPEHGRAGQTCSDWKIRYAMHWDGTNWLIGGTSLPFGEPTAC